MNRVLTDYTIDTLLVDLVELGYQLAEVTDDPVLGESIPPHALKGKGVPYWCLTFYRCSDSGTPMRHLMIHPAVCCSEGIQIGDDLYISAYFDASGRLFDWDLCEIYAGTCRSLETPETIRLDALPGVIRAWSDALEGA